MKPTFLVAFGKGKDTIRRLVDFVRLQARLEANKPTFSKFLGMSLSENDKGCGSVREDLFSFHRGQDEQKQSLVFRYRFPSHHRWKHLDPTIDGPSLSTYTSILDDVTTLAIISQAAKHPRPGVSVSMQSQWGPGAQKLLQQPQTLLEEVDIVTTITKKGRTLGFVRAEVRDPSNQNATICYFDHVKYLPTGWVLGIMLSPFGMWCLNLFLRYLAPYFHSKNSSSSISNTEENYKGIMDSYQQTSDTQATFRFGQQHSNGMGGLHGGVQAILMERFGKQVAQKEIRKLVGSSNSSSSSSQRVECERLQVSYQSSASKFLELRAYVIDPPRPDRLSVTLRIEILRDRKKGSSNTSSNTAGKVKPSKPTVVVSEGILTFGIASLKPKDH